MVVGFTGAIISLLISKPMAKWSTGAQVITQPTSQHEAWVLETVRRLASKAGIGMPEVAIYEGDPNAFATGAFKNSALVAVSTGLLQSMNREEVEAVLAHEIAHVANGDMVTLTLIQGVVNTFVVFFARIIGSIVDRAIFRTERGNGIGYFITVMVAQVVLGFLASMIVAWFSRHREFRADAGSAQYLGSPQPMINALGRLGGLQGGELPKAMSSFGITEHGGVMALFASHPPIAERIAALQARAWPCNSRSKSKTAKAAGATFAAKTVRCLFSIPRMRRGRRSRSASRCWCRWKNTPAASARVSFASSKTRTIGRSARADCRRNRRHAKQNGRSVLTRRPLARSWRCNYFRWPETSLVISNIETDFLPPNTARSFSSALIWRLFSGSCSLFFLM